MVKSIRNDAIQKIDAAYAALGDKGNHGEYLTDKDLDVIMAYEAAHRTPFDDYIDRLIDEWETIYYGRA